MRKVNFLIISIITIVLASCSQLTGSNNGYFYVQQQKVTDKDSSVGGPTVDWGGDSGDTSTAPALEAGQLSMFSVYQIDGTVYDDTTKPEIKTALDAKLGSDFAYATSIYSNWKLVSKFSGANVPEMWYSGDVSWNGAEKSWQNYAGANSSAGSNSITNMNYMRAVGYNPFFAPDSGYNTAEYAVYEGSTDAGKTEPMMKRFHFYRFTGKGGGVADLDNYLVAVDTYTKLVFSFAKPTKWGSLLGNAVPLEWGPVDLVSTGPGGVQYKFYEYDPAGYVTSDGKFHMTDDYKNNLASGNYDPVFTGKSPYLGVLDINSGLSGGGGETGYEVSGNLTVKAKYIKNVSMTDAFGDHGTADGKNSPEFIYSVRSRAYSGFDAGEWTVMSSFKPDNASILPNAAQFIHVGHTVTLGGGAQYAFSNIKEGLTLELDNRIIEIDITDNDTITDYETPVVFLGYDRYSQTWYPKADNGEYLRAPQKYDETFRVGMGQTKDFVITYSAGYNEEIEVCYEISWDTEGKTSDGYIYSAYTENAGTGYTFEGDNGEYSVLYSDISEASAKESKILNFTVTFDNLISGNPISISPVVTNSSFIEEALVNDNSNGAVISKETNVLNIEVRLSGRSSAEIGNKQEGSIVFSITDATNVYDTVNSPKEITFSIVREAFKPVDNANFVISNMKLKNLNVMDVGGDLPKGGYTQPEFSWNIKTKHNSDDWAVYANNGGETVISTNSSVNISGNASHQILSPREGEHKVYFSAELLEKDLLAGNAHDVIMKHNAPLVQFDYVPFSDTWKLGGLTSSYFGDDAGMEWQLKKATMSELKRGEKQTVTLSLSGYVTDTIWPVGNIADFIAGPKTAGWGDMELTFDVEWK